uniref:Uncharacterized protein n=1 Tax=Arundo donax TaxID=35708 RepID=A0A0A9BZJ2_ARUDO
MLMLAVTIRIEYKYYNLFFRSLKATVPSDDLIRKI